MASSKIQVLGEEEGLDRIVETIRLRKPGDAPFAFVLGSGFSWGLVPTVRELLADDLPQWIKARQEEPSFIERKLLPIEARSKTAAGFWRQFIEQNKTSGLQLEIDPQGIPINSAAAYQAAFDHRFNGALGDPALAREFQREIMDLKRPRLNAAHFFFASIIAAQPGADGGHRPEIWKFRSALSRLIVTTNFDPFLQTALQLAGRLYFISDRPDLGMADIAFEENTDAIHLVYIHGSIHRPFQAANEQDIKDLREKNAKFLSDVLKRHGVIVLGYNGWDDAIVQALAECDKFDHRLYWCGLEPDPLVPGAFGPRVPEILQKSTACYIKTQGAGYFMAGLSNRLVKGLPRMLANPVAQLHDMLEPVNLDEVHQLKVDNPRGETDQVSSAGRAVTFKEAKDQALARLKLAEAAFLAHSEIVLAAEVVPTVMSSDRFPEMAVVEPEQIPDRLTGLRTNAELAEVVGNYEEVLKISGEALALPDLNIADRANFLLRRGVAHYYSGNLDAAIADWTEVICLDLSPLDQVALALNNRGFTHGQLGDTGKAIADYTRVIENLPEAPVAQVAVGLRNRGVEYGNARDWDRAIADYTKLIENLPGAPLEQVAPTLNNRGFAYGQKGDRDKAIADYTKLIENLPDAPVAQVALGLRNRGVTYGDLGDWDKAITDYTKLIENLPGAPLEQVAMALNNRGFAYGQKGDKDKAIADYTNLIENLPEAPVEQVAIALQNRGVIYGEKGDRGKAIADYTKLIEDLPGAPVEQVAIALNNRGFAYGQASDWEKAIADHAVVIENLPGAPVEQVALALRNRGVAYGQKGDREKAIADYTRLIENLPGAPVEQVALALRNRGFAYGEKGDREKAIADYTRLIENLPGAPVEHVAAALNNRGFAYGQKGDREKAIADYTKLIEGLPGAPVEQVAIALRNRGAA